MIDTKALTKRYTDHLISTQTLEQVKEHVNTHLTIERLLNALSDVAKTAIGSMSEEQRENLHKKFEEIDGKPEE